MCSLDIVLTKMSETDGQTTQNHASSHDRHQHRGIKNEEMTNVGTAGFKSWKEDPSVCDQGLPFQVLALDSTRTSQSMQHFELLNFLALGSTTLI